jgi:hypothetical protein
MSVRICPGEKWRSLADLAGLRRLGASGVYSRKVLCRDGLQSRAVANQHGENGGLALQKAPFPAIFRSILADFLRVFFRPWR